MKKTIEIEKTETTFFIPAKYYQAVSQSAGKDEARYYLRGVFMHNADAGFYMVATNGHTLLQADLPKAAFIGDKVTCNHSGNEGAILVMDTMEKAFKAKTAGDLWIYGDTATGIAQFVDMVGGETTLERVGVTEFTIIGGSFPDYRRVVPTNFETNSKGQPFKKHDFNFDPVYITMFAKAAAFLSVNKSPAMSFTLAGAGGPAKVNFREVPQMFGVLMPKRM